MFKIVPIISVLDVYIHISFFIQFFHYLSLTHSLILEYSTVVSRVFDLKKYIDF